MKSLLLLDNFDSFTYNLVHCFQVLGTNVHVVRNDAATVKQCLKVKPNWVVVGPGPGTPSQAGISKDLMQHCAGKIPLLGVCLGHQCLGEIYGGSTIRAKQPMHGKTSQIIHNNKGIFNGLPANFIATRYHSLIIERESIPDCLEIIAETNENEIMGLQHKKLAVYGVQFHPESVLTESGMHLLQNFINIH